MRISLDDVHPRPKCHAAGLSRHDLDFEIPRTNRVGAMIFTSGRWRKTEGTLTFHDSVIHYCASMRPRAAYQVV